jgi:hypothetical protein
MIATQQIKNLFPPRELLRIYFLPENCREMLLFTLVSH